jgi:Retroviral aspartyl protease
MRFNGEWLLGADGVLRPVLLAEVRLPDGSWRAAHFLVDTGADHTVFEPDLTAAFSATGAPAVQLEGIAGAIASQPVQTAIRLTDEQGNRINLPGTFAGLVGATNLDLGILGRDVLNHFACIVDRPGDVVCLLYPRHRDRIEVTP